MVPRAPSTRRFAALEGARPARRQPRPHRPRLEDPDQNEIRAPTPRERHCTSALQVVPAPLPTAPTSPCRAQRLPLRQTRARLWGKSAPPLGGDGWGHPNGRGGGIRTSDPQTPQMGSKGQKHGHWDHFPLALPHWCHNWQSGIEGGGASRETDRRGQSADTKKVRQTVSYLGVEYGRRLGHLSDEKCRSG